MKAGFETDQIDIDKRLTEFPQSKFTLEKKDISNSSQISELILKDFVCEFC